MNRKQIYALTKSVSTSPLFLGGFSEPFSFILTGVNMPLQTGTVLTCSHMNLIVDGFLDGKILGHVSMWNLKWNF